MQIPQKLPQFTDETALLIVTGSHDAIFYVAHNGEINAVESFRVEKPQYTDIEGHFESKSKTGNRGQTMRAGSPYDPTDKDEQAVRDFLKEFEDELANVTRHHDISQLYIFTPSHIKNEIDQRIPHTLEDRVTTRLEGNYFDSHPTTLLTKVQRQNTRNPVTPMTEAARKILNKFRR